MCNPLLALQFEADGGRMREPATWPGAGKSAGMNLRDQTGKP
jgi:hypothetical protein